MEDTVFDESRFPLVIATAEGIPSAAEYETFLARMAAVAARGRHAFLLDASRSGPLPAGLRKRQAEWNAGRTDPLVHRLAGFAIVVTNPLVRGTVTAINWIHPPPYPFKVVATRAEGEAWCERQLEESPRSPPSGGRRPW